MKDLIYIALNGIKTGVQLAVSFGMLIGYADLVYQANITGGSVAELFATLILIAIVVIALFVAFQINKRFEKFVVKHRL